MEFISPTKLLINETSHIDFVMTRLLYTKKNKGVISIDDRLGENCVRCITVEFNSKNNAYAFIEMARTMINTMGGIDNVENMKCRQFEHLLSTANRT